MSYLVYPELELSASERFEGLTVDIENAIDQLGEVYERAIQQVTDQLRSSLGSPNRSDAEAVQQAVDAAVVSVTQGYLAGVAQVLQAGGVDIARILHESSQERGDT